MDTYRKALSYIYKKGYIVEQAECPKACTDFINKVVWLPINVSKEYGKGLIVHEAHHVKTACKRAFLDPKRLTDEEILAWLKKDETEAYTKQYRYLKSINYVDLPSWEVFYELRISGYTEEWNSMLANARNIRDQNYSWKKRVKGSSNLLRGKYIGYGITPIGNKYFTWLKENRQSEIDE